MRFNRLGVFSKICRNSWVSSMGHKVLQRAMQFSSQEYNLTNNCTNMHNEIQSNLPSSSSRVTVLSTYSHQCLPSVETGISQLDHLQARWMQTQATMGGLYCRQNVVRCRLHSRLGPRSTIQRGGEETDSVPENHEKGLCISSMGSDFILIQVIRTSPFSV